MIMPHEMMSMPKQCQMVTSKSRVVFNHASVAQYIHAPIAQWIEHKPSKFGVTGSNPVGRAKKNNACIVDHFSDKMQPQWTGVRVAEGVRLESV